MKHYVQGEMKILKKEWFKVLFRRRVVVSLLIIIQVVFFCYVMMSGSKYSGLAEICLNIVSLLVSLHIINRKSKNAYKIIWIFLILVFPVFGGMFYLLIVLQSSTRKMNSDYNNIIRFSEKLYYIPESAEKNHKFECDDKYEKQISYIQNKAGFPAYKNTSIEYFPLGEEMFSKLLEELKKATKYIFLEYFIIQEGKMWDSILTILIEKAREGVEVRVMYDDMGCFLLLPKDYADTLRTYNIKCKVFNPFRPFVEALQNNRDHRKIAIIDGHTAFTGGINLADEYINEYEKHGHWKDTAVMLKGEGAWSLTMMFLQLWSLCDGRQENYEDYYEKNDLIVSDGIVQPYCDSPLDEENVAENIYLHIINSAKEYLYISTPYLILDESISTALMLSAKSGVDVKIITPGIWDKRFVHFTTRSYYKELIESGIEVYEYTPGFIHSKVFVSDDAVASVGTVNLDYRSLYLHFECGTCIYNADVVNDIRKDFTNTLEKCRKIKMEDCKTNWLIRFFGEIARLFAPLL